jgi:hypothetical protein
VLSAVVIKAAKFWVIVPCRPCVDGRFGGTDAYGYPSAARWSLVQPIFDPQDGGDTFLRNVGPPTVYADVCPRRWKHRINYEY